MKKVAIVSIIGLGLFGFFYLAAKRRRINSVPSGEWAEDSIGAC